MLSGYITVEEFKGSPFYCAFETCCGITGNVDPLIEKYITVASSLIENYLDYDLWSQVRTETFTGRDRNIYFTNHYPIQSVNSFLYRCKRSPSITGSVNVLLTEPERGIIQSDYNFTSDNRYTIEYTSGYEVIPDDIKTACYIIISQLSQQIDTGNLANPNVGQSSGKVDQVINFTTVNNTGVLSNLLLKSADEIKNLPITVYPILNKYKRRKLS